MIEAVRSDRYDTERGTLIRFYPFADDNRCIWVDKPLGKPATVAMPFISANLPLCEAQALSTALSAAVVAASRLETVEFLRKSET